MARRMITGKQVALIDKIEPLTTEIIYNDKTNTIEVGGNLFVDGNIKVNNGSIIGYQLKLYHHYLTITLNDNSKLYITHDSISNEVIHSAQDMTRIIKPTRNTQLTYGSGYMLFNNVWKTNDGKLMTSVEDEVEVVD